MRILLTNDDGINAKGLLSLRDFAENIIGSKDVWTVAPSTDKSASSHAVTLAKELSIIELGKRQFAIQNGTPVDCVIFAMKELMRDNPPDLILSGINSGANVGIDTIYSGTVAAAMEGTFFGIPSFAISKLYHDKNNMDWRTNTEMLKNLILKLFKEKSILEKNTISINLPLGHNPQGISFFGKNNHKMLNNITFKGENFIIGTTKIPVNCQSLQENLITVNVLGCDLTDYDSLKYLSDKYKHQFEIM